MLNNRMVKQSWKGNWAKLMFTYNVNMTATISFCCHSQGLEVNVQLQMWYISLSKCCFPLHCIYFWKHLLFLALFVVLAKWFWVLLLALKLPGNVCVSTTRCRAAFLNSPASAGHSWLGKTVLFMFEFMFMLAFFCRMETVTHSGNRVL